MKEEIHRMPAGIYYIGDLCYVLDHKTSGRDEWDEFCALTTKDHECLEGKFAFSDGREFVTFSTMYGDGEYPCSNGSRLGVDAGLIGCVAINNILAPHTMSEMKYLGTIVTFKDEFLCYSENGTLKFGNISVNTAFEEEDEYLTEDES